MLWRLPLGCRSGTGQPVQVRMRLRPEASIESIPFRLPSLASAGPPSPTATRVVSCGYRVQVNGSDRTLMWVCLRIFPRRQNEASYLVDR